MHISNRIILDERKITLHRKIARTNSVIQVCLRRVSFKERFTSNKIEQRPQIFVKLSFRELSDSKVSGLCPFDNMAISFS